MLVMPGITTKFILFLREHKNYNKKNVNSLDFENNLRCKIWLNQNLVHHLALLLNVVKM